MGLESIELGTRSSFATSYLMGVLTHHPEVLFCFALL